MDVYLILRILSHDEKAAGDESPFLVFVQKDSDFPSVKVEHPCNFETLLRSELDRHIYNVDVALSTKSFSTIKTTEERTEIYFNFFTSSMGCKDTGSFVKFNKKSMDLYRFSNMQGRK